MRYAVGIDLGSTTTKAVILDADTPDHEVRVLGRGITNSRSNYDVACEVALGEALLDARFSLVEKELERAGLNESECERTLTALGAAIRREQYLRQLGALEDAIGEAIGELEGKPDPRPTIADLFSTIRTEAVALFEPGAQRKSDFFRDLAGSQYMREAEKRTKSHGCQESTPTGPDFDTLVGLYDKAILVVENLPTAVSRFADYAGHALESLTDLPGPTAAAIEAAAAVPMDQVASVGTGYGRARLPFEEAQIRSEILCHGLGAHAMFPNTRTVLDIGGQDTKAIQVDGRGIVTSFQMNDRCAAGCGRYLGYIADEMNLGLHELGPLANEARRPTRITSTCTVFAGAELRERLSLGERREDILAGLHRAIVLRAMSLLARSGGVHDEFTFTGGVANNQAAVGALSKLIEENYGKVKMNISASSIYTGALGAALFARRALHSGAAA